MKPFDFELQSAKGTVEGGFVGEPHPSKSLSVVTSETSTSSSDQLVGDQYPQVSRDDVASNEGRSGTGIRKGTSLCCVVVSLSAQLTALI